MVQSECRCLLNMKNMATQSQIRKWKSDIANSLLCDKEGYWANFATPTTLDKIYANTPGQLLYEILKCFTSFNNLVCLCIDAIDLSLHGKDSSGQDLPDQDSSSSSKEGIPSHIGDTFYVAHHLGRILFEETHDVANKASQSMLILFGGMQSDHLVTTIYKFIWKLLWYLNVPSHKFEQLFMCGSQDTVVTRRPKLTHMLLSSYAMITCPDFMNAMQLLHPMRQEEKAYIEAHTHTHNGAKSKAKSQATPLKLAIWPVMYASKEAFSAWTRLNQLWSRHVEELPFLVRFLNWCRLHTELDVESPHLLYMKTLIDR